MLSSKYQSKGPDIGVNQDLGQVYMHRIQIDQKIEMR